MMAKTLAAKLAGAEKKQVEIYRIAANDPAAFKPDTIAVEEPLEIRLGFAENGESKHRAVSITMRTPGNDFELATGFLFTEGILTSQNQISNIKYCGSLTAPQNTVRIDLKPWVEINFKKLERHFYTTSSCGVCGKSSLEALATGATPLDNQDFPQVSAEIIYQLPEKLRQSQEVFEATGGLHAAALFETSGELIDLREDVGRHNAVDKLIGHQFLQGITALDDKILFLSGRASFELLQKAVMMRIPIIVAVGAPSSLAVEAAQNFGVSLLGFTRDFRFNVYTGIERIIYEG